MNKKLPQFLMLLLTSQPLLSGEETVQQKIDSLGNENTALHNKLSIQNKYLWTQHGLKIIICASCIGIPLIFQRPRCNEQEIQQCLKDAELHGATIGITTLAATLLFLEVIYLCITGCIIKRV